MKLIPDISKAYSRSLIIAVMVQVVLLAVALTANDGRLMLHQVITAMIVYWGMAAILITRQPAQPSKGTLFIIRNGVLLIFLLVNLLEPSVRGWLGH